MQKTKNHKRIYDELHKTMEAVRKGHLKDRRETENFLKELKDIGECSALGRGSSFLTDEHAVALHGA